jgi:hypothetical protein
MCAHFGLDITRFPAENVSAKDGLAIDMELKAWAKKKYRQDINKFGYGEVE